MKKTTNLLNLMTAFLSVIGICAASLVCFIVGYTQINGGFYPKRTINQSVVAAQTDNNAIGTFSFSADQNYNSALESLSDTDVVNNHNITEPISLTADQTSSGINEQPSYGYNVNPTFPETDYAVNTETNDISDSAPYAMPLKQEISTTASIEQNEPNDIYSSEVPIESSNQIMNGSITTENKNNISTYNTPETQVSTPATDTVWLSATGEKYHSIDHCGRMNPNKARQVSLEYAISAGYGPCEKCF